MWKETVHLIGLHSVLVSLFFALLICSPPVTNSEILDGSEAPMPSSGDYFTGVPVYSMSIPEAAKQPQKNITLIFAGGVIICLVVFIATYCIAYRTIFVRQGEWNHDYQYRSRQQGMILEEQNHTDGAGEQERMNNNNNGGLESSLVSSFPIVQYKAIMFKEGNRPHGEQNVLVLWVKECAVCLSEFEEGEQMKVLPGCGHCFHKACINMWLFSHTTCPICRLPLRKHLIPPTPDPAIPQGPPRGLHVAVDI